MSKVIRIEDDLYQRISTHSKGFETPSQVLKKMVDFYEKEKNIESNIDIVVKEKSTNLDIVYYPTNDVLVFKQQLLNDKIAYIKLHNIDGTSEIKEWDASRFKEGSSVDANLRSGYLRNWKDKGIFKAEISTNKKDITAEGGKYDI